MNKLQALLSMSALAALIGCAGNPAPASKTDATTTAMDTFRAEMAKSIAQAKTMLTSMNAVVTSANQDPRAAFTKFSQEIAALEAQATRTRSSREAMQGQGRSYFENWEKQLTEINNPEVKKLAAERKEELSGLYGKIQEHTNSLADNAKAFVTDVKDLEKALALDLSAAGITRNKPLIAQFTKTGDKLIVQAEGAMKVVDQVASVLRVKIAQPPPPEVKEPAKEAAGDTKK